MSTSTNQHVRAWREAQKREHITERVFCGNWNPSMDEGPQRLRILSPDGFSTVTLGYLIPVDEEAVRNSPGIQSWSKPGGTRSGVLPR